MQRILGYKGIVGVLAVLLAVSVLMMPIAADAAAAKANALPQADAAQACADAEMQAEQDVNGTTWLLIGCVLGIWGYLIAYVLESNPPASALVGKSPAYVAKYTDCYKQKAKQIKTKNALYGCLAASAGWILYYVLVAAAVSSAATIE